MSCSRALALLDDEGLNVPDLISVLVDAAVAAEESHPGNARDGLGDPFFLVLVRCIHQRVGLVVAVEVVRYEVVVTVVTDRRDQGPEVVR